MKDNFEPLFVGKFVPLRSMLPSGLGLQSEARPPH